VEYLYRQTGKVLQDYNSSIEEIQSDSASDLALNQEEDEGFTEGEEFEDLTIPTLEPVHTPPRKTQPILSIQSEAENLTIPAVNFETPNVVRTPPRRTRPILSIPSEAEYRSMEETIAEPIRKFYAFH